ncbi:hypothetical protein FPOAC2_12899 [Fusarium poae]
MLKPEINTAAARFRYLEWLVLAEWKDNDDASMILDPNEDAILVTDDKHSRPFYLIGNLPLLEWIAVSYIKMNSVDLPELKLILNVALWTQVTNKLLSHGEGMSVHSDTITPCATIESPEVPPVREIRETAFSNLMTHIMGFHRSLYEPTRPRGVIDVNLAEQSTLLQLLSRRTWLDNLEPLPTVEKYRSGLYAYISCSSGPLVYMYPGPASEDSSSLTKSDVGVKDDELGGVELKVTKTFRSVLAKLYEGRNNQNSGLVPIGFRLRDQQPGLSPWQARRHPNHYLHCYCKSTMDRTVHHDWLGLQLEHKITEGLYQRRSADTDKSGYYSAQVGILKQDMVTLTILRFIRNALGTFVYMKKEIPAEDDWASIRTMTIAKGRIMNMVIEAVFRDFEMVCAPVSAPARKIFYETPQCISQTLLTNGLTLHHAGRTYS